VSHKKKELKVCSILGARPQLVKAAAVSRAIRRFNRHDQAIRIREILIHTGQHYDFEMSQVFFAQLKLPRPAYNLGVGSGPHGLMTGKMLMGIEKALLKEKPDWALVYGDTNSTLAGAFAAAKIPLPIAHVEAGLRSFNRDMPEEINRLITDHLSALLFCPTQRAVRNLRKEGIVRGVFHVGDVMYDAFLIHKNLALKKSSILQRLGLAARRYCLATVHRQENTDDLLRLESIFKAFDALASKDLPFVIPIHPRTRLALKRLEGTARRNPYVRLISPLDYFDITVAIGQARAVLTDSGGIQKESFFAGIPCVTLRNETEWTETIESGWNYLGGAHTEEIIKSFSMAIRQEPRKELTPESYFGDGQASRKILEALIKSSPFDLESWSPARPKALPLAHLERSGGLRGNMPS
jgi:UDP-N-acetylglucosamine 2-epimerase